MKQKRPVLIPLRCMRDRVIRVGMTHRQTTSPLAVIHIRRPLLRRGALPPWGEHDELENRYAPRFEVLLSDSGAVLEALATLLLNTTLVYLEFAPELD